jgi:hypothetical protein
MAETEPPRDIVLEQLKKIQAGIVELRGGMVELRRCLPWRYRR